MMVTGLLVLCFVPCPAICEDTCSVLELNHIYNVRILPWNQGFQVDVNSYWLGRRRYNQCGEVWVVDWWRRYNGEVVVRTPQGVSVLIRDKRHSRTVLVRAESFRQTWTEYDVELEQRRWLRDVYGFDHKMYRRGLAGAKPQ